MGDKLLRKITVPYIIGGSIMFAAFMIAAFFISYRVGLIVVAAGVALGIYTLVMFRHQRFWIYDQFQNIEGQVEDTLRYSFNNHPLPFCVADRDGLIPMTNGKFKEIFPETKILKTKVEDVFGHKHDEFLPENNKERFKITVNERIYQLLPTYLNKDVNNSVIIYMQDITELMNIRQTYDDEKVCMAYVTVDNYDELISRSPDERRSLISSNIENVIRQWAGGLNASILRYKSDRYLIIFGKKHYNGLLEGKFSILDEARKIQTDADFPVSLSIGLGLEGDTPQQTAEYAGFALDMAFGRGGDQAVVKKGTQVRYYGGKVQVIEKRNKGKSRVMSHAMKRLMKHSSKIIIMGHKNPDMDSLGSAIGIHRIAFNCNKDAHIVMQDYNYSLSEVYEMAEKSGTYKFVNNEEALSLVDKDTLLVVVDTHIPNLTECPELLSKTEKIILIDHHRRTETFIDNATLTYMEPSASSTSELITEILQYDDDNNKINKLEAELLLAGIYVDTNGFSVNTGTRTFEAASWLRQNGAASTSVRQFLQTNMEDFKQRAEIISNAEFMKNGVAISKSEGKHANSQITVAQAADELLDIKGIIASFVVGETKKEVVVSARSLGELNVQTIMERLGGGGHLTMAAAQIKDKTPDEVIRKIKKYVRETISESK